MLAHKLQEAAGNSTQPSYIEDVFSTYLYTANGGNPKLIGNGIDLSTKGGMVWIKNRSTTEDHALFDTARGFTSSSSPYLSSNLTAAQTNAGTSIIQAETGGFRLLTNSSLAPINTFSYNYASWTFRKQRKFFDVVTYTGDGAANRRISHNLGAAPGFIVTKRTDAASDWMAAHLSAELAVGGNPVSKTLALNTNAAASYTGTAGCGAWCFASDSSTFYVFDGANVNGATYVAYLFANNAGGFGLTGTDNVISCGSFTTDSGGNATVNLGYEPQWVLMKSSSYATDWVIIDNMRGMVVGGKDAALFADLSSAEASNNNYIEPSATGFSLNPGAMGNSQTSIYIAIRRGPMKVPTDGTSVFSPTAITGTSPQTITTNFPVDLSVDATRSSGGPFFADRLRGGSQTSYTYLRSPLTNAEATASGYGLGFDNNNAIVDNNTFTGSSTIYWNFRRAPGFFDEVCDSGTGSAHTINHSLGAIPELIIRKNRTGTARNWTVACQYFPNGFSDYLFLNSISNVGTDTTYWNATAPTSSVFSVGTNITNSSGSDYVTYLFATLAGISKVGSYTGNGTTQTINCGFAGGARFVLIKRTDSTGDWYVYDTARGMTTLTDPYLLLNSTAAESATLGSVTTVSGGFALNASILAAINTNGASYIYLAIA